MKQSIKAKRLAKHHKRYGGGNKLNLVALMDIFTILVLFLIVNQSEVTVLKSDKSTQLPVSLAEELPSENLLVSVIKDADNNQGVMVQERLIWSEAKSVNRDLSNLSLSEALINELKHQASRAVALTPTQLDKGRGVTIMGDAKIHYQILKPILAACGQTEYRNISLAVEQKLAVSAASGQVQGESL